MNPFVQVVLTSACTAIGGVFILVVGQAIIHLLLVPLTRLREAIGEVADSLAFFEDVTSNPGVPKAEMIESARVGLRKQSTNLRAKAFSVPYYDLFVQFGLAPTLDAIDKAARGLMGLSLSVHNGQWEENREMTKEVRSALDILN